MKTPNYDNLDDNSKDKALSTIPADFRMLVSK